MMIYIIRPERFNCRQIGIFVPVADCRESNVLRTKIQICSIQPDCRKGLHGFDRQLNGKRNNLQEIKTVSGKAEKQVEGMFMLFQPE